MKAKPAQLVRQWVHSHEEDQGGQTVFRPASFSFPLSRGRTSLHLKADGSFIEGGPGPTDRPQTSKGKWEASGQTLILKKDNQTGCIYDIVSATTEKLVLKEKA